MTSPSCCTTSCCYLDYNPYLLVYHSSSSIAIDQYLHFSFKTVENMLDYRNKDISLSCYCYRVICAQQLVSLATWYTIGSHGGLMHYTYPARMFLEDVHIHNGTSWYKDIAQVFYWVFDAYGAPCVLFATHNYVALDPFLPRSTSPFRSFTLSNEWYMNQMMIGEVQVNDTLYKTCERRDTNQ